MLKNGVWEWLLGSLKKEHQIPGSVQNIGILSGGLDDKMAWFRCNYYFGGRVGFLEVSEEGVGLDAIAEAKEVEVQERHGR